MNDKAPSADLDPTTTTTIAELAALLSQLRDRHGARPTRRFEEWAKTQGRTLGKSTVAELLAGKRLPSHTTLETFLDACGVNDDDKEPWLAARNRIDAKNRANRRDTPAVDHAGTQPADEPPPRPRLHPAWIGASLLAAGALAVALTADDEPPPNNPSNRFTSSISCQPRSCQSVQTELLITGRSTGRIPSDQQALLMTRVESTGRWYLGATITPTAEGTWQQPTAVGNPDPQPKDRRFTICLYLLPEATLTELNDLFIKYGGKGLAPDELPADGEEVACTAATRLRQPPNP